MYPDLESLSMQAESLQLQYAALLASNTSTQLQAAQYLRQACQAHGRPGAAAVLRTLPGVLGGPGAVDEAAARQALQIAADLSAAGKP